VAIFNLNREILYTYMNDGNVKMCLWKLCRRENIYMIFYKRFLHINAFVRAVFFNPPKHSIYSRTITFNTNFCVMLLIECILPRS